jgi:flagellin
MGSAAYKGKNIFVDTANSEYVSMGGRNAEMTFGIGKIDYSEVFGATRTIDNGLPNAGQLMNLTSMPSDAVVGPTFTATKLTAGKIYEITTIPTNASELVAYKAALLASGATTLQTEAEIKVGSTFTVTSATDIEIVSVEYGKSTAAATKTIAANKQYVMNAVDGSDDDASGGTMKSLVDAGVKEVLVNNAASTITGHPALAEGDVIKSAGTADVLDAAKTTTANEVNDTTSKFVAGQVYEIVSFGAGQNTAAKTVDLATFKDVDAIGNASADIAGGAVLAVGTQFTVDANVNAENLAALNALTEGMTFKNTVTDAAFREIDASKITRNIEAVQKKINTGRVQAGSQYAALESAVIYTTDLTAQYELGYNTVHDVNFSMETAHLAKNQILQQAATAMLAQANQGQQGLLQLIQG